MNLKPIGVNIVVKKDPKKPCTEGGILIPEMCERTPRFGPTVLGTVMGVGARCNVLKVGDRVALKDIAGDDILWGGNVFTHLREKDIVGLAYE